jgi:succinate-semialdehyde dehydrogenase/glutarate-semialdehyde dehydrogenase
VFRFSTEEEALARANATEMGLAGYFYSRDSSRMWRLAERLEVGIVGVNNALPSVAFAPMGGVKQSGIGREGSDIGLEEFQDLRYLAIGL